MVCTMVKILTHTMSYIIWNYSGSAKLNFLLAASLFLKISIFHCYSNSNSFLRIKITQIIPRTLYIIILGANNS